MSIRNALDKDGNIVGTVELPEGTSEEIWTYVLNRYISPTTPISQKVYDKLVQYERAAPGLLRDMKTSNTLAGITLAQSAQMFAEFQPLLLAIREGAFPTALYILQNTAPSGFVTQVIIDDMIAKIISKL